MGRPLSVSMDVHFDAATDRIEHRINRAGGRACATVTIGDAGYNRVTLYCPDLAGLVTLGEVVETIRQELAAELGLLPNGEPCAFIDVYGSIEWNEHDHDRCLSDLVDDPEQPPVVGTAWERHDDPTAEEWSR